MTIAIDCRLIGQSGIGTFIENVVRHMVDRIDTEFVLFGNLELPYRGVQLSEFQSERTLLFSDKRS